MKRGPGQPRKPNAKQNITMRLSPDVIAIIRSRSVVDFENSVRKWEGKR